MPRRLVYYFFISDDYETNFIYKIHFACLKYFVNVFDEAVFILSSNNEAAPYMKIEHKLLGIFRGKRITIQIQENSCLCEATTFYNEVVKKDESVLTFFFHTKGVNNIKTQIYNPETIYLWVLMIYYYSLNFINDMETYLLYESGFLFYGACRGYNKILNLELKEKKSLYLGSGYWVNNARLTKVGNIPKMQDRWYCETFPYYYDEYYKSSYKNACCFNHNFYYGDNNEVVSIYENYDKKGIERFNDFKENILKYAETE